MSNKVNISINGKQRTLNGWPATAVITSVLVLASVGLVELASALYASLF